MKNYNQVFNCPLPVDLLAEKLLETLNSANHCPMENHIDALNINNGDDEGYSLQDGDIEECKRYTADYLHYVRVTESIIDAIQNNGSACASVFNALNGWVKLETPADKVKQVVEQPSDDETCAVKHSVGDYVKVRRSVAEQAAKPGFRLCDSHWQYGIIKDIEFPEGISIEIPCLDSEGHPTRELTDYIKANRIYPSSDFAYEKFISNF